LDTNVRINWLLDFYGAMLTARQRALMEMHYCDDLSLSEISETLNITRQAVHDSLRRSERTLENYEKKLGLVSRYFEIGNKIKNLRKKAEKLKGNTALEEIYSDIAELADRWES